MKNICIAFLAALLLTACVLNGSSSTVVIEDNSTVIDVRTEREFREGHLKNAVNIPHDIIKDKIKAHASDKNEKIFLYCRSGRRSGIAKKMLEEMGYTNVINAGGYEALKSQAKKN